MKYHIFAFLIISLCLNSCLRHYEYRNFTLANSILNQNNLEKNGFYYSSVDSPKNSHSIYFFYEDGSYAITGINDLNLSQFATKLETDVLYKKQLLSKIKQLDFFGKYQISGDNILLQRFESYSESRYCVIEAKGNILSNTALIIKEENFIIGKKKLRSENLVKNPEILYFYSCNNCKPDSSYELQKKAKYFSK